MKSFILIILFAILFVMPASAQSDEVRIVFYNVENYFDPVDDSLKKDEEFTPKGTRYWSWRKYNQKTAKIYKAITAFSQWKKPDIISLCEIENRYVLNHLLNRTPFGESNYKIVHKESDDFRGIDVGLFYNPETIWPLDEQFLKVRFENKPNKHTRDILYFKALLKNKDTLHVFVNHWPSKYGGAVATIPYRARAAKTLKHTTDSILNVNPNANIVITGDFNDTPDDESIKEHLDALPPDMKNEAYLVNLSAALDRGKYTGTHRYQGQWSMIDQFIVSPAMVKEGNSTHTGVGKVRVGFLDMLLETDKKYTGKKPFRTFIGFKYHGGFSDHLPILIDLQLQ